jgi:hypothetical protein
MPKALADREAYLPPMMTYRMVKLVTREEDDDAKPK